MGMSTHIIGFRPSDDTWHKMKCVFDSCREANVPLPKEVEQFFNGETPDASGVKVDLNRHPCVQDYKDDMREGFEVDLSKLPPHVTKLRFYNSW